MEKAGQQVVKQLFVPYPEVESFKELNDYLHEKCMAQLAKNSRWQYELQALKPLPTAPFKCARYSEAKVNTYSMIQLETNRYSVPFKHIDEKVTIRTDVDKIDIVLNHEVIADQKRIYGRNKESKLGSGSLSGTIAHESQSNSQYQSMPARIITSRI